MSFLAGAIGGLFLGISGTPVTLPAVIGVFLVFISGVLLGVGAYRE